MISIDTAETDEFIDITNVLGHSDKFGEFYETLINENNLEMPHDVTIAFGCTYSFRTKSRNTFRLC